MPGGFKKTFLKKSCSRSVFTVTVTYFQFVEDYIDSMDADADQISISSSSTKSMS
jgi:hypothetical protein